MDQILIKDLLVRAVIGINDEERSHRWDLLINLVLYTDTRTGARSDAIEDCVNYASVSQLVFDFVDRSQRYTVEALAADIADLCLTVAGVEGVRVRLEKPGVVRFARSVGVEIERFKNARIAHSHEFEQKEKPWNIRRAKEGDIPALVEMRLEMFKSMGQTDARVLEKLRTDSTNYMQKALPSGEFMAWVAEAGDQVAACAGLVIHMAPPTPRNPSGREGYVMNVFTYPEWRQRGMARGLMLTLIDVLHTMDARVVTLRASEQGTALYLGLGFKPAGETMMLVL